MFLTRQHAVKQSKKIQLRYISRHQLCFWKSSSAVQQNKLLMNCWGIPNQFWFTEHVEKTAISLKQKYMLTAHVMAFNLDTFSGSWYDLFWGAFRLFVCLFVWVPSKRRDTTSCTGGITWHQTANRNTYYASSPLLYQKRHQITKLTVSGRRKLYPFS